MKHHFRSLIILCVSSTWCTASALAQEPAVEGRRVTVRLPSGAQVEVLSKDGTEQEVLQALEEAARQWRGQRGEVDAPAVPGPAPAVAAASPTDGPAFFPGAPLQDAMHAPCCEQAGNKCIFLPATLLWMPPLANQREPRSYIKGTTLKNDKTFDTIDTAIGATFALFRWGQEEVRQGVQLDFFAAVFSRWSDQRDSVGVDYRFGLPVTFAWGPWSAKVGYEHTSTHVGDELAERTGQKKRSSARDELVVGLAYSFWDSMRVYGQAGYAFGFGSPFGSARRARYDWGVEWIGPEVKHLLGGQPFAAFDMDVRGDQSYTANMTTQVGWRWTNSNHRPALRIALEYYDGRSPYGQFLLDRESWFGAGVMIDY